MQTMEGRIYEKIQEKSIQQCTEKIKENHELKSVEKDVVANSIKYMMESSSDAEIYIDNDDSEEDKVIRFR